MNPTKRRKYYKVIDKAIGSVARSDDPLPAADHSADLEVEIAGQILSEGSHTYIHTFIHTVHTYTDRAICYCVNIAGCTYAYAYLTIVHITLHKSYFVILIVYIHVHVHTV